MSHRPYSHIEQLIQDGGEITIGALEPIPCVASAATDDECPALLKRRRGETFLQLIDRLDEAIGSYFETGDSIDEINH
jgi:hypothetical protein